MCLQVRPSLERTHGPGTTSYVKLALSTTTPLPTNSTLSARESTSSSTPRVLSGLRSTPSLLPKRRWSRFAHSLCGSWSMPCLSSTTPPWLRLRPSRRSSLKLASLGSKVAFRESVVTWSVAPGPKMLPFNPLRDPVPELPKLFTSTLGLSIALLKTPYYEGTCALYLRVSSANKRTVLLTAAHVACPPHPSPTRACRAGAKAKLPGTPFALGDEGYSKAITSMLSAIGDSLARSTSGRQYFQTARLTFYFRRTVSLQAAFSIPLTYCFGFRNMFSMPSRSSNTFFSATRKDLLNSSVSVGFSSPQKPWCVTSTDLTFANQSLYCLNVNPVIMRYWTTSLPMTSSNNSLDYSRESILH